MLPLRARPILLPRLVGINENDVTAKSPRLIINATLRGVHAGPPRTPEEGFRVERLYANGDTPNSPPLYFFPLLSFFLVLFSSLSFSSFSRQPLFLSCEVPRRVNRGQYGQTDLSVLYIRIAELKRGEQPRHANRSRSRVLVPFLFLASLKNLRVTCIGTVASGRTIVTYRLNKTRRSYALSIHLR